MQSFPAINEVKYSLKRGAPIFRFFGMRDLPYFDAEHKHRNYGTVRNQTWVGITGLKNPIETL